MSLSTGSEWPSISTAALLRARKFTTSTAKKPTTESATCVCSLKLITPSGTPAKSFDSGKKCVVCGLVCGRPALLDVFSGAGGAAAGYRRAGFCVLGVDHKLQPRYTPHGGCRFVLGDALEYVAAHGREFDAIHASPPCQAFTALKTMWNKREHDDLVEPTRCLLQGTGLPWVIENVPGAPLSRGALMLCGTMFSLGTTDGRAELRRHRYFELSEPATLTPECRHGSMTVGAVGDGNGRDDRRDPIVIDVYGGHERDRRRLKPRSIGVWGHAGGRSIRDSAQQFSTKERAEAMGIDWMTGEQLSQAIPPAYTEYIGLQLMAYLRHENTVPPPRMLQARSEPSTVQSTLEGAPAATGRNPKAGAP